MSNMDPRTAFIDVLISQRIASRCFAAADYNEYVERKKNDGEKPLDRDAWEARTQGGKDEDKKDEDKKNEDKKNEGKKDEPKKAPKKQEWHDPKTFRQVSKLRHDSWKSEKAIDKLESKLDKLVGGRKVNTTDVEDTFNKGMAEHKKVVEQASGIKKSMDAYLDKVKDVVIKDDRTLGLVSAVKSYSDQLQKVIDAESKTSDANAADLIDEGRKGANSGKENKWYHPLSRKMGDASKSMKKMLEAIEDASTHMYEIEHKTGEDRLEPRTAFANALIASRVVARFATV